MTVPILYKTHAVDIQPSFADLWICHNNTPCLVEKHARVVKSRADEFIDNDVFVISSPVFENYHSKIEFNTSDVGLGIQLT